MQNKVLVLDTNKTVLAPTHPANARKLLNAGKAAVYRQYPFTIILKRVVDDPMPQPIKLKVDPGSKTTGLALVQENQSGDVVVWAGELEHRGQQIKNDLLSRRQLRQGRRGRKTRHRKPRFDNRTRPDGWLPPSLNSRVRNIQTWFTRLYKFSNIQSISVERVKFDMQKMASPETSGAQYQQGELQGYEVREYLLEKWNRECSYCKAKDIPLEIEHIVPKSRGGSNSVGNLCLACRKCNVEKGNQTAKEFGFPDIQAKASKPLKDAAAVNATRNKIYQMFLDTGLPVETGTGSRTKFNRISQGYDKAHWIDAACVGESGSDVNLNHSLKPLRIKAKGRQSRQMVNSDKYGFPRGKAKSERIVKGFKSGDMVKAGIPKGKYTGSHVGNVSVRHNGCFKLNKFSVNWKYCSHLHRADGYQYGF